MTDMDTLQPAAGAGTVPPKNAGNADATIAASGHRRRPGATVSTRSNKSTAAKAAATADIAAPASQTAALDATAGEAAEGPNLLRRRPRVSRAHGLHNSNTEEVQSSAAVDLPTQRRVDKASQVGHAAPVVEAATEGSAKKAHGTAKSSPKTSRSADPRRKSHAAKSTEATAPVAISEGSLAEQWRKEDRQTLGTTGADSDVSAVGPALPSFATEPYRPAARASYRFGRARQESGATDAEDLGRAADDSVQQKEHVSPVAEHGHRPLRRSAWAAQNGQEFDAPARETHTSRERVQPHVPGGADAYRGRQQGSNQRPGGAGPSRLPGSPGGHPAGQHGQYSAPPAGQSGRGNTPYSPGGRAGHSSSSPQPVASHDMGYLPANGQNANNTTLPAGAYGGYDPHDPYAIDPHDSRASHDRPTQTGRTMRGRGNYTSQPGGYEQRDQRPPRQSLRPPSPADYYRREQGITNQRDVRGVPPGRSALGSHGAHDRRGAGNSNTRAPAGSAGGGRTPREPRESGYSNSLYTPVPGGPTLAQNSHNDGDRYERSSSNAAGISGMDVLPGIRSAGPVIASHTTEVTGILWQTGGSFGSAELLDGRTLQPLARVSTDDIRRVGLRQGDILATRTEERSGRRFVVAIDSVNDLPPEAAFERPVFDKLTASFPERRIRLERGPQPISVRIIDLFAPLGFGSRALVVAPPKTGKTTLMREAAEAVLAGYPSAVVMAVLVGERPEEVTDLRSRLEHRGGLVYAASFDEDTQRHAWLVQLAVERAKRVAESGRDAFMVLDSLTRLARAENLSSRGQGRTLSGGIDAQALDTGRRAFGAARNLDEGGSLTILATCLVDTGSRQDDVVYEEFKGTGNMELHLSRELAQRRLFPAVDAVKSSTRREEMLLTPEELRASTALRRRLADLPPAQATQQLLSVMERTPSNAALLQAIEQSGWIGNTR
ncbi:MAG: transcription termination factor Rho [Ktedonobacterales bacterium]